MKVKILIHGTILSILVFCTISFVMLLYRISPLTMGDTYSLDLGFPWIYYEQFQLKGNDFVNSSWDTPNLMKDCLLTWIIVTGIYVMYKRKLFTGNE